MSLSSSDSLALPGRYTEYRSPDIYVELLSHSHRKTRGLCKGCRGAAKGTDVTEIDRDGVFSQA